MKIIIISSLAALTLLPNTSAAGSTYEELLNPEIWHDTLYFRLMTGGYSSSPALEQKALALFDYYRNSTHLRS